jgi:uncharacterized RDD family membrane protein YckC
MENELYPHLQPEPTELYLELKEMMYEQPATVGQRFLNYLVDIVIFYLIFILIGMIGGVIGLIGGSEDPAVIVGSQSTDSGTGRLVEMLITWSVYILYYTFFEGITKGRTVGKMLSKTKAVKADGSDITPKDALMRSLCRLVPFEPFSAFGGNPWHDKWTNTKVIKDS